MKKRLKICFISIKMENLKVKDLKPLAKEKGIKGYYRMRKAELIHALSLLGDHSQPEDHSEINLSRGTDIVYDLININSPPAEATEKHIKNTKLNEIKKCPHEKRKSRCKDCGGSEICTHNRVRYTCKDCKGDGICEHNRERYHCKDCKGKGICIHGKNK